MREQAGTLYIFNESLNKSIAHQQAIPLNFAPMYQIGSMLFRTILAVISAIVIGENAFAQLIYPKEEIFSPYTIENEAAAKRRKQVIDQAEALNDLPLGSDEETAYPLEIGLWGIAQFRVSTPKSDSGIERLIRNYDKLNEATRRALLEAAYAMYPGKYVSEMKAIASRATHPRNFAMAALHLYRAQPTMENRQWILQTMRNLKTTDKQQVMLQTLGRHISGGKPGPLPSFDSLFAHQQVHGFKVVYSFQRANRDHPGLAIVQEPGGNFARDSLGQLKVFVQLARSGSNLPYFLTNGSTPQGLYAITGTAISRNVFIGPTPNLQSAMMHEVNPPVFTHYMPIVLNATPERIYRSYFPQNWQQWHGLMEAYDAGRIGRSEIIAHGSTIDPEWFAGETYYPLSPTLGCLSGLELWNKKTGRIDRSDQLELVNTFIETPGTRGFLIVIDLDDKKAPVTREEVEGIVMRFELARQ
ncbi:MAG TPA: hypothetical protein VK907_10125 [Phnomibacter sp.]|nr:hypothetical protein [Phnomibacter sp.]